VSDLKTLLVECLTPQSKSRMDEMDDIAKAAGYNVVGHVTQRREAIDAAYCIGEGKLDEIAGKYMKAQFDHATDDQAVATLNRRFLRMVGYSDREADELNPATLSEERMIELLRQKGVNSQQNQDYEQDVVPMSKVEKKIREGWEYIGQLPNGKAIVKRKKNGAEST